jgi:hypothetical protein
MQEILNADKKIKKLWGAGNPKSTGGTLFNKNAKILRLYI